MLHLVSNAAAGTSSPPPWTDYCAMLGADDIQGLKSGFLSGNHAYYVGGTFLVQKLAENETLGLTHPFYHDLRSRGTGIAEHPGVGVGNVEGPERVLEELEGGGAAMLAAANSKRHAELITRLKELVKGLDEGRFVASVPADAVAPGAEHTNVRTKL